MARHTLQVLALDFILQIQRSSSHLTSCKALELRFVLPSMRIENEIRFPFVARFMTPLRRARSVSPVLLFILGEIPVHAPTCFAGVCQQVPNTSDRILAPVSARGCFLFPICLVFLGGGHRPGKKTVGPGHLLGKQHCARVYRYDMGTTPFYIYIIQLIFPDSAAEKCDE